MADWQHHGVLPGTVPCLQIYLHCTLSSASPQLRLHTRHDGRQRVAPACPYSPAPSPPTHPPSVLLQGHTDRLGRVAFHPMGRHLATASFDMTWRLWDCESGECLLEQEGHSRGVYAVAFQQDGALAGSVGLDAIGGLAGLCE
jgi:WD40 repeat protein